jgi:hypothetical protein
MLLSLKVKKVKLKSLFLISEKVSLQLRVMQFSNINIEQPEIKKLLLPLLQTMEKGLQ